jgi:hypothetical protein
LQMILQILQHIWIYLTLDDIQSDRTDVHVTEDRLILDFRVYVGRQRERCLQNGRGELESGA